MGIRGIQLVSKLDHRQHVSAREAAYHHTQWRILLRQLHVQLRPH